MLHDINKEGISYSDAEEDMVNVCIPISSSVHRMVKTHAAIKGKSIRDVIRECIEDIDWKEEVMRVMGE